ncbi:hypothetical protein [Halohasta litorea]|uniref:Phage prohead protease, HK97 family n=1 Tax=Halohasta litorea TaxID=869891 RepID=A0ABD6D8L7_9EURY|nr:hypothetical protein [Halohasta litorea]
MNDASDESFCEIVEGTFSTSQEDRVGDEIPPEELERLKDQIKNNPEKRTVLNEHNPDEVIGEIIDVWTEWDDEGEILFLRGKFGIFERFEDIANEMKSGEKTGLSIGGYSYPNISKEEWGNRSPDALVEIPADEKRGFYETIESYNLNCRLKIEKSLAEIDVFEFLIQNHEQVIELTKAVAIWYLGKKSGDASIEIPEITLFKNESDINIDIDIGKVIGNVISELNKRTTQDEVVQKEDVEDVVKEKIDDMYDVDREKQREQ